MPALPVLSPPVAPDASPDVIWCVNGERVDGLDGGSWAPLPPDDVPAYLPPDPSATVRLADVRALERLVREWLPASLLGDEPVVLPRYVCCRLRCFVYGLRDRA